MTTSRSRGVMAVVLALAATALAVFAGSAFGEGSPPENTKLPTMRSVEGSEYPYTEVTEVGVNGIWKGEPTKFTWAWYACNPACEELSSHLSYYHPTPADVGKKLKVAVTATNAAGSTTAYSALSNPVRGRLSWYSCDFVGSPAFEDAGCSKSGGANAYGWVRNETSTFKTVGGTSFIQWINGGVPFKVACSGMSGTGNAVNSLTTASVTKYAPTLTGCSVANPPADGCKVAGGSIALNSLGGTAPEAPSSLKSELTMKPTTGTNVATFTIEGCKTLWTLNVSHTLWGSSFPAQLTGGGRTLAVGYEESSATLKLDGGYKAGIDFAGAMSRPGFEPERAIKLATAP